MPRHRVNSHPLLLFFGARRLTIKDGIEMLIDSGLASDQAQTEAPDAIDGHLERLKQFTPAQTMAALAHFNAEHFAPEGYYIP